MNDRDFALRPEAGSVPYESLFKCQKDALNKILAALDEAQQLVTQSKNRKKPFAPQLSRIFFVSGPPGSGKSSLYFTLREILSREESSSELHKKYQHLASAIRWLELIDLEVVGDEGENLLAAVLVRICSALDIRPEKDSAACQGAINQLEILANDIGIAWEGNLRARASSLDSDSYSQEVMHAQRARLRINERLRKALDKLSDEECYGCSNETLFVLPVDDFYLKPAVSLELLRLLRMISVPRLFFLVMGDEKTMQALFLEKALADWTAIAGPQVFGSLKGRQQEVLSRAREMSARYFRKLLPSGQRAAIDVMTWQEALGYKPAVEAAASKVSNLSQLLSGIDICDNSPQKVPNLLDFLTTKKTRISLFEEGYSAFHILEAGPREVMDLWKSIYELKKNQDRKEKQEFKENQESSVGETPAYLEEILQIVLRTIEEQDFLTEKQQEVLRFAFPISFDAGPVMTDKFELRNKDRTFKKIPTESTYLFVRRHFGWETHVADNGVDKGKDKGKRKGNRAFSHLPPRQAAWIILLHDLSVCWNEERTITHNLVCKVLKSLNEPMDDETAKLKDIGWARYQNKEEKQKCSHFPLPDMNTFRQLDRFLTVWNYGLSTAPQPLTWAYLVRLWIHAGWIVMGPDDRYDDKNLKFDENDSVINGNEGSWEEILEKIKTEFKRFADKEQE